jgi:hypothetical protein
LEIFPYWEGRSTTAFINCPVVTEAQRHTLSRCVSRTAALWPTYNPQDRKVGATCDSTPFFGKYDIAEWVGCARAVTHAISQGEIIKHSYLLLQ